MITEEEERAIETITPLASRALGKAVGDHREARTVPNLSRQSEWTSMQTQQFRDLDYFARMNSNVRACIQMLVHKITGSGIQIKEKTPVFSGEKREAFYDFINTVWKTFAEEVINQVVRYGFTATSWVPHKDFVGRPVTIDLPNVRPEYKFNHQREFDFRYLVDDMRRLIYGLYGDDDSDDENDAEWSSGSSSSSEEDDDEDEEATKKRKRAKAKRRVVKKLKKSREKLKRRFDKKTREPWTHFRHKPTIQGVIDSPLMSVLGEAQQATVALELMLRNFAQRVNTPIMISKKADTTASALSIATDTLSMQASMAGLSTDPSAAGPPGPGGGGGGGGGGGAALGGGKFSFPDCPPVGGGALGSRFDSRAASQIQSARITELAAWMKNRGIPIRNGLAGAIAAAVPGSVRLQPNEQVERPPEFKDPPKVLEFLHRIDEKIYLALGVPMSLVNRDGMNVTLSKSDSTTKDSASERLRETVVNLGTFVIEVLNKQYERIYMGHFAAKDITQVRDSSSSSSSDDEDSDGEKRPSRSDGVAFKHRCQFFFNGLIKMEDVMMYSDAGLIDESTFIKLASATSNIPLRHFRPLSKQSKFTFGLAQHVPSSEELASDVLLQGQAQALVAHAMPQKATLAKSASGKGQYPINPPTAPKKASMDAIDSKIAELRGKKRDRSLSPSSKKKTSTKKTKTSSSDSKSSSRKSKKKKSS